MTNKTSALVLISSGKMNADIHWFCQTEPPETAVFIKKDRRQTLLVSEMEYNRMRRAVRRGVKVLRPELIGSDWKKGPVDWIRKTAQTRQLTVTPDFPLGLAEKLKTAGFKLTISAKPVCPQREIKTDDQIEAIRYAQRAAVAAMKAAIRQISSAEIGKDRKLRCEKKILTSENVRATINHTLLDHDCVATETIVACGPQSADPHERGTGPLRAGQPIVIDIFPRFAGGYWGDITRTVCRGPAPAELKKMYNAVKAGQAAALKMVKSGARADTVHKTAADEMEKRGYKTGTVDGTPQGFIHGTGHGVGLEIHEAPRISPANHQKLRTGHIITIEPGLYYPELGGIRIEDTVAVTKDGYRMLATCSKRLEI